MERPLVLHLKDVRNVASQPDLANPFLRGVTFSAHCGLLSFM